MICIGSLFRKVKLIIKKILLLNNSNVVYNFD